jgi:DNA-binding NarL/FixJ family response regulator
MSRIRVLIVDDHDIVREGLKSLLGLEDDIEIVGTASVAMDCIGMLKECYPDVILMDLKMPGVSGIEATRLIKRVHPLVKVVLLTNYDDEEYIQSAVECGVDGYVLKDVKRGDLANVIRIINEGKAYIDPSVTYKLLGRFKPRTKTEKESSSPPYLSERELQILELVVEGRTNREIADILFLSLDTVKSHLKNIFQKLRVNTRSKAVRIAIQKGIVHLSGR